MILLISCHFLVYMPAIVLNIVSTMTIHTCGRWWCGGVTFVGVGLRKGALGLLSLNIEGVVALYAQPLGRWRKRFRTGFVTTQVDMVKRELTAALNLSEQCSDEVSLRNLLCEGKSMRPR